MDSCEKCIWFDQCGAETTCEYFSTMDEDAEAEAMIAEERAAFFEEWYAYIEQEDEQ